MSDTPNDQVISLDDIDSLLEQEDPEFQQSMAEVRAVENDASVTIEASTIVEIPDGVPDDKPEGLFFRLKRFLRAWLNGRKLAFAQLGVMLLHFLKTKPKAAALALGHGASVGIKGVKSGIGVFAHASRKRKAAYIALAALLLGALATLRLNFKGSWLPALEPPILKDFSEVAGKTEAFDKKDVESFYRAFPRERNDYLFPKMKVNLRRTTENPVPMGAFELVAELDSKDTAIEMREREVELSDLVQRIFEEQSFNDLASDLGKQKLKSQIKRELDSKLTQGYVRDIDFKTFILKP